MKKILELLKNPFVQITLFAFVLQTFLLSFMPCRIRLDFP